MNHGLLAFLSEESVKAHSEYLNTLNHRWSVVTKSYPAVIGKDIHKISRMRLDERENIIELKCNIMFHELYFSSFGARYQRSAELKRAYGSEAEFLYRLYLTAEEERGVGVAVSLSQRDIRIVKLTAYTDIAYVQSPALVVDVAEHSYFADYGFDRCAYLKAALSYLNISCIDKKFSDGIAKRNKP